MVFLKQCHLRGVGIGNEALSRALGDSRLAGGVEFGLFQVFEDFLGAGDNRVGKSCESGDLDAIALVGAAGEDFSQEDDLVVPLADGNIEVLNAAAGAFEVGELVVVGGKEGAAADFVMEVFRDTPGDGQAVECGGAAPDFVENHEAAAVALLRMFAVSFISTMKVDCPRARSSFAPTRVKIRSVKPRRMDFAGT